MKNDTKGKYKLLNNETIKCTNGLTFFVNSIFRYTTNACLFKVIKDGQEYIAKTLCALKSGKKSKDVDRFINEAKFLASNKSTHVVEALGYGIHEISNNVFYFYVMQKFDGSYRDLLNSKDNYSVEKRIDWLYQIAIGIEELHNADVVHRDIKPENIFYCKLNDKLYIGDFGISHFKESDLTKEGEKLANFNYASPEQLITQKKDYDITKNTDIYSFGLIVNETFTGSIPRGNNYTKIGDIYPELCEFDKINDCLLGTDPQLRLANPIVAILKIKEVYQNNSGLIQDIQDSLLSNDSEIPDDSILYIAAKDILTIEKVLEFDREKGKYINRNYHSNILYLVSHFALDTAFLLKIQDIVNKKFEYEANVDEGEDYVQRKPDKKSFEEFRAIINNLNASKEIRKFEIFKKFSSLRFYHCQEVLDEISSISTEFNHEKMFCISELYFLFLDIKKIEQSDFEIIGEVRLKELQKDTAVDDEIMFQNKKYEIDHNSQMKRIEKGLQDRLQDKSICVLFETSKYHIYLNEKSFKKYIDLCEEKRQSERPGSVDEEDIMDCEKVDREIDEYKIVSLGEFNFLTILGAKILKLEKLVFFL